MRAAFLGFLAVIVIAGSAEAQVTGRANVITSDSFSLGPNTYRLHGVDSVEFHQFCFVDGEPWACGASATRAFQVLLDPVVVTCEGTGEVTPSGEFAICTSVEGDIAEIMVSQGWAFANPEQTDAYVAAQTSAQAEGTGIWRGLVQAPWEYRQDIAAIEQQIADRARDALPGLGTQILTEDFSYVPIFDDFEVTTDANTGLSVDFELQEIGAGFIPGSIPDRGIFDWREPAAELRTWRNSAIARIQTDARIAILASLAANASEVIETSEAAAYYNAMTQLAAPMRAEGLQPVLLIIGSGNPIWFGDWFGDAPPEGAEITRREDIDDPDYMGTIDGIDVYRGTPLSGETYFFAEDAVEGIGFVTNEAGEVISVERGTNSAGTKLDVHFEIEVRWSDAPVTTILYPYESPEGPYGS